MTTRANIYIDQGTDFSIFLDVVDDNGDIVNLTDVEFESDAKKVYSESVAFTLLPTIVSESEGKLELSVSAETTNTIRPGKYKYDLIIILPTGKRLKLLEGLAFVIETVTEYAT